MQCGEAKSPGLSTRTAPLPRCRAPNRILAIGSGHCPCTQGVESIFQFGVDNVLCHVVDPLFVGFCASRGAECGVKTVPKKEAHEKVGVLALQDGKPKASPKRCALKKRSLLCHLAFECSIWHASYPPLMHRRCGASRGRSGGGMANARSRDRSHVHCQQLRRRCPPPQHIVVILW